MTDRMTTLRRLAGIESVRDGWTQEQLKKEPQTEGADENAIQPLGTVNSRKDGDWLKTEKGWVRITKSLKATIGTLPAGTPTSKAKKAIAAGAPAAPQPAPLPPAAPPAPKALTPTEKANAALKGAKSGIRPALARELDKDEALLLQAIKDMKAIGPVTPRRQVSIDAYERMLKQVRDRRIAAGTASAPTSWKSW